MPERENNRLVKRIDAYGGDILRSSRFRSTRKNIQHGTVSVYEHSISVAIRVRERELVRGALLHDYFLYDWHTRKSAKGLKELHGFSHPEIALRNAGRDYSLTPCEREIIRKHMWPLTVVPPMCREAWIVTAADKYCSLLETLRLRKGRWRKVRKNS